MGLVLVKGAVVKCTHSGQLKLSKGDTRLTVDGNGAVTQGMEAGLTFGSPHRAGAGHARALHGADAGAAARRSPTCRA